MKYKLLLIFSFFSIFVKSQSVNISQENIFLDIDFNGWNGTLPSGFSSNVSYRSSTASTTGGSYSISNSGFGWQASSSVNLLNLEGTFYNSTGSTQTSITIEYNAFEIVNRTSRTPGWSVTSSLGDLSLLNWIYNSVDVNTPDIKSITLNGLNIPNNTSFTITWSSDRGSGSGSSPMIGLNNIKAKFNSTPASTTTWNGTTWSNGAPTSSVDAIIDGTFSSSGNFICKDLTVNAGATLTINAADKLSVMGDLVNNGSIIFKSNNTSTGRFDSYSGDPVTGTGTVTMERYIDGKRAFRLLAPGVTTSGTIANNWQQQVFITGSTTGANGFDTTTSGAASMFTFENLGWTPISNTDVLNLNAQTGYRILIRGDRTPSILTSQSNGTMNTPITLTAMGTMVTGNVLYNTLTGQEYTLVANPYISPIDWATVTKSGVSGTYYAWDPNLGTGNQRGRFVSCDVAGTTSILENSGSPNTAVDQYIQPGQAFFIQKSVSGVNGSITIKESDKSDTFTDVFRNANTTANSSTIDGKLGINLYESIAYSLGEYPIDGAVAVSGASFNTNTATDDTKKIISHGEQVAFVRENEQLGVEKVNLPQASDELAIATINLVTNKNYVWSVVLQDNFSNEDAYLLDTYTQNYHPLTATNTTVVPFETTADVASTNENRFKIVFQNTTLNTPTFDNQISLYPNPSNGANGFYITNITASAKVALFTVLGQSVPVFTALNGTTLQVKPMHDVAKGIYVVQVIAEDGATKQVKWIVE